MGRFSFICGWVWVNSSYALHEGSAKRCEMCPLILDRQVLLMLCCILVYVRCGCFLLQKSLQTVTVLLCMLLSDSLLPRLNLQPDGTSADEC